MGQKQGAARKGKDMLANRFALSYIKYPEYLSGSELPDRISVGSRKAKGNGGMASQ